MEVINSVDEDMELKDKEPTIIFLYCAICNAPYYPPYHICEHQPSNNLGEKNVAKTEE